MPDAVKAVRQDVDQEAADELGRGQRHDLLPVAALDPASFQRNATVPASVLMGRRFGMATLWVYRLIQASTAFGPPKGGLASCRRRASGTMTTHSDLRKGANQFAKASACA